MEQTSIGDKENSCESNSSNHFILANGKNIKTIQDMEIELKTMPDNIFLSHVNHKKNDFSVWIENIFNNKELADKIKNIETKEEMIKILDNEYKKNKTVNKMISQSIKTNKNLRADSIEEHDNLKKYISKGKENENNLNSNNKNIKLQNLDEKTDSISGLNKTDNKNRIDEKTDAKIYEDTNKNVNKEQIIKQAFSESHLMKTLKEDTQEFDISVNSQEKLSKEIHYDPICLPKEKVSFFKKVKRIFKKEKKNVKNKKTNNKDIIQDDKNKDIIKRKKEKNQLRAYKPEYIKTGIRGFDELIINGIPKGSAILLSGGTGTGKTTFSLNILHNLSNGGKKCLYLTFEEDPSRLVSHMINYGFDPLGLEKKGLLKIKKMDPFHISRSVEALLAKASGELIIEVNEVEDIFPDGFRPDYIVLDSLSAVAAAFFGKEEGYRIYVEQLFNMFKNMGATSFLISEVEENANTYTKSGVEEFLADAVVVFYNLRQKNVRVSALEIIKIRGTNFQKKIVPFKIISGQGIKVYPKEDPFLGQ